MVWLDAYILFQHSDWIAQTSNLLELYRVLQPFSEAVRLPKDYPLGDFINARFGLDPLPRYSAAASTILGNGDDGHPGYAWAARRKVIESIGFFECMAVGGADRVMSQCFLGLPDRMSLEEEPNSIHYAPKLAAKLDHWRQNVDRVINNSVNFVPGFVFHLYHGDQENRQYLKRHEILNKFNFDPDTDLQLNESGGWEWASDKKEMQKAVKKYFKSRQEDGNKK